ncbi:MAG: STAS domain-containing protein [Rubripirellula sp.]
MSLVDRHGAVTVLRPTGPLRAGAIQRLDEEVHPLLSGIIPHLVIDLAETPLIDGEGLEWILTLNETCCRRGGCVRICNAGELCRDILRITEVGDSVQQFDDLTIALGSFA